MIRRAAMPTRCRSTRAGEAGHVTFFGIGMVVVLLFVSGFSVDLWRAFSERRALSEMADAAAAAGANGVDVVTYRSSGEVLLDPTLAEDLAWQSLATQTDRRALSGLPLVVADVDTVEVLVVGEVEMTLLSVFMAGEPFTVTVRAEAAPRRGG